MRLRELQANLTKSQELTGGMVTHTHIHIHNHSLVLGRL